MAGLLEVARPHAQDLGCESALDQAAELAACNGAERQRLMFQQTGNLAGVVAALADQFRSEAVPPALRGSGRPQ
jgi:gamma-glutamyl:cysteine ligase YbdK (ATP-grasp superfamily)